MSTPSVPASWTARSSIRSPELRQDRAQLTRSQILRSAAELFANSGFAATTLKQVAEGAHVTKGALYFHFPSKEHLAIAVVEEHYSRWPAILAELAECGLGPFETAIELLARTAIAFRDDIVVQGGARLQIERDVIAAELPTPYVGWISLLTDLLVEAAELGHLRPGADPPACARVLVSSFFGMQHVSDILTRRQDIVERWEELRDALVSSMRA